jgi:hypothetical protein
VLRPVGDPVLEKCFSAHRALLLDPAYGERHAEIMRSIQARAAAIDSASAKQVTKLLDDLIQRREREGLALRLQNASESQK